MLFTYFLEFCGATILSFSVFLFGKAYAHLILSAMLFSTGTLFTLNCFNPVIAVCYVLKNTITLHEFYYYVVLELFGALCGYYFTTFFL
jgi:hypothetical protein